MRKLYANVNLLLRKLSNCAAYVKCFVFKPYSLTCIVPICRLIVPKQHARKKLKIAIKPQPVRFKFLP